MRYHFPNTLAFRLTLWYAGLFILFTGAAFLLFYLTIDSILDRRIHEDLVDDIKEFRLLFETEGEIRLRSELKREAATEDLESVFIRLFDPDGNLVFATDLSAWSEQEINRLPASSNTAVFLKVSMAEGDEYASIVSGPLGDGFQLQVGESLEEKNDFMGLLLGIFGGTFLLSIPLGTFAGWFMAKRAMRGIEAVSQAAIDVAQGRLDRQVEVRPHGEEIHRLVDTFNVMVGRLNHLVSGMREMTDNIAHDLRSPLGRIRAEAEQALSSAESVDDHKKAEVGILEECDRLLHMINTTLDVAETEAGVLDLDKHETDISLILHDACELFEPLAEDKGIEMTCRIESDCRVTGNNSYLQRMLANLLDNALKYTKPDGRVGIKLEKDGGKILINVSDTGAGIEEDDQKRVFDRFFRCDTSRSESGCGLGLSLARAIARAHGGDIIITSNPDGGSIFTVTLPMQATV